MANGSGKPLSVMSALAVEVAFKRWILPAFEQEAGVKVDVVWDPTTVLLRRVREGQRADIILAIDHGMDALAEEGIIRPETRVSVAQAILGVAVKQGAPRPDISTMEAFTRTLLDARAVAYSLGGASGLYFGEMIKKLGIADAINAKAVTIPAGFTATKVASGEAELAIQQFSELMSVDGVDVIGPFPDEVQSVTNFSAAIFTDAKNPVDAALFLKALVSDDAVAAYRRGGLNSLVQTQTAA